MSEPPLRLPLHQIEAEYAPARRRDTDLVYLFDLVLTNGRLLDRLGLDLDDEGDERRPRAASVRLRAFAHLPVSAPLRPVARLPLHSVPAQATVAHGCLVDLLHADVAGKAEAPRAHADPLAEQLVRSALHKRQQGVHREASYMLQAAAQAPHSYPRAMLLYAQALRAGLGVKQNEQLASRWLCRCILVTHISQSGPQQLAQYVARLSDLSLEHLLVLVQRNVRPHDPVALHETFAQVPPAALAKAAAARESSTVAQAYRHLGDIVVARDEAAGLALLAEAAAVGSLEAMVQLGELWNTKTKAHRREPRVAAAWLRLAELFGKKDIGNLWIYKEKYMRRK